MEQNRCPGCMNIKSGGAVCEHCGYDERKQNMSHQLQTGTVLLGKYLIGRVLGQGSFGITYLGWNRYLNMKVAIKECFPCHFASRSGQYGVQAYNGGEKDFEEIKTRFSKETKNLAKLQNTPGIVTVLDFFEENNTLYMVMEYLEGMDLRDYVRRQNGRLTPEETFRIMRPVMKALIKAHGEGILHMDINPDNIMVLQNGSAKLMDFAGFRSIRSSMHEDPIAHSGWEHFNPFAPMELCQKRTSLTPATDEYALCATMLYCMTGRVPQHAVERHLDKRDLEWDRIDGLTEAQKRVLRKGTAIDAKERYSDICQLMEALFASEEDSRTGIHNSGKYIGWQTIGDQKYYFGKDGETLTGWQIIEGGRYYLEPDGKIKTGWLEQNGRWFCFDRYGEMVVGWREIGENVYHFARDGVMTVGWFKHCGDRYYFNRYGEMVTGRREIAGVVYRFGPNGRLETDDAVYDGDWGGEVMYLP